MYRSKKDVDKHVETLTSKLSLKEFNSRAYSIARLYFDVGDYASCVKYVEQYLTCKDKNAAAHKLLGQAFQKSGQKEKALEQYKISLDIDPTQTSTILDICELLADDEVTIDPGRAKYWCEKAEAIFPRHTTTFRLREKLLSKFNPDPEALVKLLKAELVERPKEALLHAHLLKHYLNSNQVKDAFEHSCNVEFDKNYFSLNNDWYEIISQVLKNYTFDSKDWLYQLLLLTVKERLCLLSLTDTPSGSSKSLIECNDLLFHYDQAIENVARVGAPSGHSEFHSYLLQHHKGQLALHTATFLLKKAKKDLISWRESTRLADPLMLIAWQTVPMDSKVNWLLHAPEKQRKVVQRWYVEGSYRCSQSGHYLLSNCQDKSQLFLDQISQFCSGSEWKEKLYKKLYPISEYQAKIKTSHITSNSFHVPAIRLPRRNEVEAYDDNAQREYPNSLHHIVWILVNYKNLSDFKCTLFDMLMPTVTNSGPEALSKIDIYAFAYCAALSAKQKHNQKSYATDDKPCTIPANITDLLCSLTQMKWWDCAYKFCQNELGTELTDIRATLSAGIEVVRCIDNHGLDPELLCILGRIFSEQAKAITEEEKSNKLEMRAFLYYSAAIPLLNQLKNNTVVKVPKKRIFDYTHSDLGSKELNTLIEECKLFVALIHLRDGEFEKVIDLLAYIKSPKAFYYLGETYKRIALEEIANSRDTGADSKCMSLLLKSKQFAYKALDKLKQTDAFKSNNLYTETQDLIEDIEACINKVDPDYSTHVNNIEGKYVSDENISLITNEQFSIRPNHHFRNISSTPKHQSQANITNYRSAIDSQLLENNRIDNQYLERIETHIRNLQKRDAMINEFMEQTKVWFKENNTMGNQIINTIHLNTENTTEQFKLLKISIDQVKGQIDECRNECKDVVELKKQVAELKKEVFKLKKGSSESTSNDNDLYNLDENYRTSESATTFTPHIPFTPSQVIPPFTQRLVPPFPMSSNPYHMYGQNLYSLYNQYSQFTQPQSVPGAQLFDPTRGQMNFPNVYPTPDQMYLDAHLIPPNMSSASTLPSVSTIPMVSTVPLLSSTIVTTSVSKASSSTTVPTLKPTHSVDIKEPSRSLPVNVVITSSDPLPTSAAIPAPVLSVTVPPQHIKASPHNYQIPMPTTTESKTLSPPKLGLMQGMNKQAVTTKSSSLWNPSIFADTQPTSLFNNSSQDNSNAVGVVAFDSSPNISLNKSRTLSEKSNTSVENYDPCPDFKPIIPLPAEVKVTTGEEDEVAIFSARAKLFRFVDKQWKERGLGEMKLLQHKKTGKVRVLMRREQIHKICANHIILPEMEIKPMMNETKAYFWVANDFAEETVIFEKFCIRFKTAEIAKLFYDTFEKARQDAIASTKSTPNINQKLPENSQDTKVDLDQNKTVVGGFTFSSTPSFKSINNVSSSDTPTAPQTSKSNVFSSLSFKPNTSTQFSNLFNTTTKQTDSVDQNQQQTEKSNKLNTSDTVEEFEPAVDFKPVVPLPALVDQKTGEEDEIVLFEHRAKLLRYDSSTREWKERGLGNIKLLMHKDNNKKIRLLMRREQIMKVCCNHAISKEMTFQKMPNMDKAVTWCAKDFSEGELVAETFCLRFKTVQICDEFLNAVMSALSKIDDPKTPKEGKNEDKKIINQSNGDKINPPQIDKSSSWGDRFKPKAGCWECKTCYIQNKPDVAVCCACNTPKEPTSNADPKPVSNNESQYSFVMPKTNNALSGWGDKFKPKEGSWECDMCLVRNNSDVTECSACNKPRHQNTLAKENKLIDQNAALKENKSIFTNNVSSPKFTFGISHNVNDEKTVKSETNLFSTNTTQKFTFGFPSVISFGDQKTNTNVFGASKSVEKEQPLNFSIKNNDSKVFSTPKTNENDTNVAKGFGFTYKPPQIEDKSKDVEKNKIVSIEEAKLPSSPFSILKEVDNVSEEENEILIFGQRANLYKFISGKWEKHGVGIVKILKHKENNKLRIIMRQDKDSNICFNYNLTSEIKCKPKDEKTWHLTINDCSEGESRVENFCLEFPNAEHALKFKIAVDIACDSQAEYNSTKKETDDVVFVGEIQASNEDKQKAIELKLPENFYTYKSKPPCQGCRGCNDEDVASDVTWNSTTTSLSNTAVGVPGTNISTPVKGSKQSPTNSSYGTPSNFNETADVSIFRTPLGAVGSNTVNTSNITSKDNTLTDKSNTGLSEQKLTFGTSNIFNPQPSSATKKSILAPPKLDTVKINTSIENQDIEVDNKPIQASAGLSSNKSIFDLSSNKKDLFQKSSEIKSIFGDDQKPINLFSGMSQGSIFGPSALKSDAPKLGQFSPFSTQSQTFSSIFGKSSNEPVAIGSKPKDNTSQIAAVAEPQSKENSTSKDDKENKVTGALKIDNDLSFATLSSNASGFNIQQRADFKWEGAGQQLFTSKVNKDKSQDNVDGENEGGVADEYDPHYEPIVPLPAKIVVTTGEEDEVKLFGERCKLFRYDEKGREWKERGVGEIKVLFHPKQMTYRLLLRREQVHKLVLNMLLFMDLQLLPMKNSNRAWTWAGMNYGEENAAGEQEMLAVRFKTPVIATNFHDKVVECVRSLQAAAAEAIRKEKETAEAKGKIVPLQVTNVPQAEHKAKVAEKLAVTSIQEDKDGSAASETNNQPVMETKQVHFEEAEDSYCVEEDEGNEYREEDEDYDHYQHDESDEYNEEEEDESGIYFSCEGEAIVEKGSNRESCAQANIQVLFDQNLYSPKILVTDMNTGEVLADTLIFIDTEFQLNGDSCTWTGVGDDVNKTFTINFPDNETAVYFYDSCETSKTATCSSMDNES
ncbi:E3 SUMO-protein ligase RanBP2 [Papilio machaon]|uniref:E3 SUMO-protein ligase RanBP2 n=1 Tax=Papilio machaon TaxID=76193 RepID=A0A194R849_PAPMA|nr:E3 SUMO-protein ligase RanBP2 [Papilio machaon]